MKNVAPRLALTLALVLAEGVSSAQGPSSAAPAATPSSGTGAPACAVAPTCAEVALDPGPARGFRSPKSRVVTALGSPHHRARDLFQVASEAQWLSAKFAYGKLHKDLEDEDVDVYLLRGCKGSWEKLGTARTTTEASVAPDGRGQVGAGRAFLRVPAGKELDKGLHRARFVVAGDSSTTDAVIEILAPGAPFFVSDIDGTLTSSEDAEIGNVLRNRTGAVQPDAARVMRQLADKGLRPLYLSARPDWITERTHQFLAFHGFPNGAVRVTMSGSGVTGQQAAAFKTGELAALGAQGLIPSFAFGNRPTDTVAFENAKVPTKGRFFLGLGDPHGGRRIETYTQVLPELAAMPCR